MPTIMAWIVDTCCTTRREEDPAPGVLTGKPLVAGGSRGRDEATRPGVCHTLERAFEPLRMKLKATRPVARGFGNAVQ